MGEVGGTSGSGGKSLIAAMIEITNLDEEGLDVHEDVLMLVMVFNEVKRQCCKITNLVLALAPESEGISNLGVREGLGLGGTRYPVKIVSGEVK